MIVLGGFRPMPKPEKQEKPKPKPIAQKSKKLQRNESIYNNRAKKWLEGKGCRVCNAVGATQVHHKKGRQGFADKWALLRGVTLLNDERHWLPVCAECHQWVEANPIDAKILGYTETRTNIKLK